VSPNPENGEDARYGGGDIAATKARIKYGNDSFS
jgi:hypothetical protein